MLPDLMANLEQSPLGAWIFDYGLPTPPLIDHIAQGCRRPAADPGHEVAVEAEVCTAVLVHVATHVLGVFVVFVERGCGCQ